MRYLEKNREELEQTALGAYAVVDSEKDAGVIWVLRQRNVSKEKQTQVASPVHPFYIVHVRDDGKIRHGCASVKQTLDLFQELSLGKTEAIHKLCDEFNRETENGADMAAYDSLLNAAVEHIGQTHGRTQTAGLGLQGSRDFRLPRSSETPDGAEDFELVTWLVMLPREQD